jgi:2-C-methyl-D-erythritol 4-phosphate cytidylyltransferase / 2-C-methyl-D-erythritol 2,4-cyclodiphosphate synthase
VGMTSSPFAQAVVVAAGSSNRMGGVDKLEASILGWSVLRWAVEAMVTAPEVGSAIVVAQADRVAQLASAAWLRRLPVLVVSGGRRRQDSVAAGVRAADAEVVLVHDAARPLVEPATVSRVAAVAREDGAAVPLVPIVDSLRRVEAGKLAGTTDREGLHRAQTPQGARRDLLLSALEALAGGEQVFGDEAELLTRHGVPVTAVAGQAANLKVTLPDDLELARQLAAGRATPHYATGHDSHPFGPDDGLRLGGIDVPEAPRLAGHSDGDVVLHALCDGLLAATGEGDLGRLFPSGDPRTRGIESTQLLDAVLERVRLAGWRAASVDVSILGARPRLGAARLEAIRTVIATRLEVDPGSVAVKAATGNLTGPEGAGRVISSSCMVGVVRR